MNNMIKKYRFKTEQEFIDEFGKDFRNKFELYNIKTNKFIVVHDCWVSSMDYLFGKPYNKVDIFLPKADNYYICEFMITEDIQKISYKPKTLVYD
jgi:hypothetical protein